MGFARQEYWGGVPLPSPLVYLLLPKSHPVTSSRKTFSGLSSQVHTAFAHAVPSSCCWGFFGGFFFVVVVVSTTGHVRS